ncbi:MAG TPA: flagellar basal-body MS-ring/collar protein FliF [Actinomycetota bacterium]|jgi:flagellar M-ring protein FliF
MDKLRTRIRGLLAIIPPSQRVVMVAAVGLLAAGLFVFAKWLTAPSYTLLYSDLDDKALATVIDQLDAQKIPYKVEGGGSQILVPRQEVYKVRAELAKNGVGGSSAPAGYELLDSNSLATSDFKQRVAYRRALEGELSKTIMAMDGIDNATVRLALPSDNLFEQDRKPETASVLVHAAQPLSSSQVQAVVFLVSSSVEGLDPGNVTVADATGKVLTAAGQDSVPGSGQDRNTEQRKAYEANLVSQIQGLLGGPSGQQVTSVVVSADLDFSQSSTETETYDPASKVQLREQTSAEKLTGNGTQASGVPGVTGQAAAAANGQQGVNYEKTSGTTEYGINRTVTKTTAAPGTVKKLSVAIMLDDGTKSGAKLPKPDQVKALVSAAVGLDPARGDTIEVTPVAFPKASGKTDAGTAAGSKGSLADKVGQFAGVFVLLVVAVGLFLMSRGRKKAAAEPALPGLPSGTLTEALPAGIVADAPAEAPVGALGSGAAQLEARGSREEVLDLVQRQPEEIAALLRSWLADRRG